ncbi:MAG: glycosyltransferase family 39 protein [Deltaproteobacteria bacterium]|nr:glycosyltransferase family 39 protein [Deltaproteobacteria bacterium]
MLLAMLLVGAGMLSASYVSRQSSPVWDETHFFGIGNYLLETGRFDIPGIGIHPPVAHYLGSIALLGERIPLSEFGALGKKDPRTRLARAHVKRGNALLRRVGFERFLQARWPFIVLYGVAGLLVFFWSRRAFGDFAGLYSLALYLASPTLLANGFLLTNDFTLAFFLLLAFFCLMEALERPGPWAMVGFVFAAAITPGVKLTGLLLAPLSVLAVLIHVLRTKEPWVYLPRRGRLRVSQSTFLGYWGVVAFLTLVVAYFTLVLLYQGDWSLSTYRTNAELVAMIYERGHTTFLDGERTFAGFGGYYLLALWYKTPLALLAAWILALVLPRRWVGSRRAIPLVVALVWVVTLSILRYNLGLRYILIAYPLLSVLAGRTLAGPSSSERKWPRRSLRVIAVVLVVLALAELAWVFPYPRSYVNPVTARGPGYEHLADMDLDWGGGLVALRRYIAKEHVRDFAFSYHGSVEPAIFGIHPSWYENPSRMVFSRGTLPSKGLLFVSSTNLSGVYGGAGPYLRGRRPVTVVGGTIYVFRIEGLGLDRRGGQR